MSSNLAAEYCERRHLFFKYDVVNQAFMFLTVIAKSCKDFLWYVCIMNIKIKGRIFDLIHQAYSLTSFS